MAATADSTIVAVGIASARSVMRGMSRKPRPFGSMRDLARTAEAELDGALEALKRMEDTPRVDHEAFKRAVIETLWDMTKAGLLDEFREDVSGGSFFTPQVHTAEVKGAIDLNTFTMLVRMKLGSARG